MNTLKGKDMSESIMNTFAIGDSVRIKRSSRKRRGDSGRRGVARIQGFYSDVEGGVFLDTALDGFVSWNVLDLERVERLSLKENPNV